MTDDGTPRGRLSRAVTLDGTQLRDEQFIIKSRLKSVAVKDVSPRLHSHLLCAWFILCDTCPGLCSSPGGTHPDRIIQLLSPTTHSIRDYVKQLTQKIKSLYTASLPLSERMPCVIL